MTDLEEKAKAWVRETDPNLVAAVLWSKTAMWVDERNCAAWFELRSIPALKIIGKIAMFPVMLPSETDHWVGASRLGMKPVAKFVALVHQPGQRSHWGEFYQLEVRDTVEAAIADLEAEAVRQGWFILKWQYEEVPEQVLEDPAVAQLQELVDAGNIHGARRWLATFSDDDPRFTAWRRVLAPPVARSPA